MSDETNTTEAATEQDFVLKIQLGILLPMRVKANGDQPDVEDVHAKSNQLADALIAHIRNNDVAPQVVQLLDGEAMSVAVYEQVKESAKQQAKALAQVMQALAGAVPEDSGIEVTANGMPVSAANAEAINQLADSAFEDQREGTAVTIGGEAAEPEEPTTDGFRVSGTRTLQ